jgi:hypothetical protein
MSWELTDGDQASKAAKAASSLKRQRWAILLTGLAGAVLLIAFQLGAVPGLSDDQRTGGAVVVFLGSAFLVAAGASSWWLWTRLANSRTARARLTDQGIAVEFVGGETVNLDWANQSLQLTITEFSASAANPGATLQWGSGRLGHYAHISHSGAERVKAEAQAHGFRLTSASIGKPPNVWYETRISRT